MSVMRSSRREEGFGIVVVALLFTAFAVIMATMLDRNSVQLELDRQQQVDEQLSRLSVSLARYARFNGHRFPCPASHLATPSAGAFGVPVGSTGGSPTYCHSTDYAGVIQLGGTGNVLVGVVPVNALIQFGISYNEAFDPWGSRIMYVVHRKLTTNATNVDVASAATERPRVQDYLTSDFIVPDPDFVLVSFGRDRAGGRLRSQTALASPAVTCTNGTGQRRFVNCNMPNNATRTFYRGPIITGSRVGTGEYFDDSISSLRYLGGGAPSGCSGVTVGGFCWYYAADNQSCDSMCSTHNGYNDATRTYAGSSGTLANCQAVLTALGIPGVATNVPGGTPGCVTQNTDLYRYTIGPTSSSAAYVGYRRACACNN